MPARACSNCLPLIHEPEEHKNCLGHHHPDCPEMKWSDGHRRGTVHESEMAIVNARKGEPKSVGDRLALIFGSKSEETPVE